jgi:WD40 repeat protein
MQPRAITDEGVVFFDGNGVIGLWSFKNNSIVKTSKLSGRISDVYSAKRVLAISDKNFILQNTNSDSLLFEKKHPDWPIYVKSRDTTVRVPVSLALTDVISTEKNIYSSSIDKSIRKWNVENGELIEDLLGHEATISALSLSKDETQLVSVDLKGCIKFWSLKNN